MTSRTAAAHVGRDPLASFDLDNLLGGAARLRPERRAIACAAGVTLTYAELDERASSFAAHMTEAGFAGGECVLIVGAARATTIIAMIGAARAGLDVAMAPRHFARDDLAAFADACGAVALAAEMAGGDGLASADDIFAAASQARAVRMVLGLDAAEIDGAVAFDPMRLEARPAPGCSPSSGDRLFVTREHAGLKRHTQQALVAAAIEIMSRARIGMRDPVVSTLAPVRFGALAAGPFAALLAGCALHLHAPFDAAALLAEIEANSPCHLVAPAALALALADHDCLGGATFASLLLTGAGGAAARLAAAAGAPVIDLDGFLASS